MIRIFTAAAMTAALITSAASHAAYYGLDEAIAHALAHNPDLAAVRERAVAAAARERAADAAHSPEIGLSLSARSSDNALDVFGHRLNTRSVTAQDFDPARLNDPSRETLYTTELALRLPVYRGGRLDAESRAAAAIANAGALDYARARERTAFETIRAYRNLQLAAQGAVIAQDAVEAAREHARTTAALARQARIVVSDKLSAEVYLASMQSQEVQARTRLEHARSALRLVMGLPPEADVAVAPYPGTQVETRTLDAVAALIERALAARKDLAAAKSAERAAIERVAAARAAHRPKIDVIAARSHYDDGDEADGASTLMGVLSLDLYTGGRNTANVSAQTAERRAAEARAQALAQAVRHEVRTAYDSLQEALRRHELAKGNVERAGETVRLVKIRYGQGRTILLDLLQSERALVEARNEELTARLNVETGYAALDLALGTLALPEETRR